MSPIPSRRSPVSLFAFLLLAGLVFAATGCYTGYPGGYGRGYGYGYGGGGGCGYGCGYGNGYYNRRPYYNNNRYYQYGYGGKGRHHDHDDDDDHRGRRYEPYRGPSNGPSNGPPGPTQAYQGPSNGPPGSPPPKRVSKEERNERVKSQVRRSTSGGRQSRSGDSEWRGWDGSRD